MAWEHFSLAAGSSCPLGPLRFLHLLIDLGFYPWATGNGKPPGLNNRFFKSVLVCPNFRKYKDWWSAVDRLGLGSLLDPRAAQYGGRRYGPVAGHPSGSGAPRGVARGVVHLQRLSGLGGGRGTLDWHLATAEEFPAGAQGQGQFLMFVMCFVRGSGG